MIILQKTKDAMKYLYTSWVKYPRSEKLGFVSDYKKCLFQFLIYIITAQKKYYKKTTLQDMDVEVMKLRAYIRLSHQLGFLPTKKYEIWSGRVVEIGKMLGGWIKAVNAKKPT